MATTAIILAAGSGTRFGGDTPKQLLELAGIPLVIHSVAAFANHRAVDHVVVVTQPNLVANMKSLLDSHGHDAKVIVGGDSREASTQAALALFADAPDDKLLIHDAVRPLVSANTIAASVDALDSRDAAVAVLPAIDTMFEVDTDETLTAIPLRSTLRRAQTPQSFRAGVLRAAFDLALADPNFVTTDDIGVVHRYSPDATIKLVAGSEAARKVTTPADLTLLEAILQDL